MVGIGGASAVPANEEFSAVAVGFGEHVNGALDIVPATFENGVAGNQEFDLRMEGHLGKRIRN